MTALSVRQEGGNTLKFRIYQTDIVVWDRDNKTVTLNSGGFQTTMTKRNMNQISKDYGLVYKVA